MNPILVALDVESAAKAIALADELRGTVGGFKIGKQLFTAAGPAMVRELADRGDKTVGHGAGLFGRSEAMPPVVPKEPGDAVLARELRDVGIEIHPVNAFQFANDVFSLEFGDAAGYIHGGSGWAFVTPLPEIPPPC